MIRRIWTTVFTDTFETVEKESIRSLADSETLRPDIKVIFIMFTAALCLVMIEYFANLTTLIHTFLLLEFNSLAESIELFWIKSDNARLLKLQYWSVFSTIFYFLVPVIIIKTILKDKLSNYGLSLHLAVKGHLIYLAFFLFMVPLIIGVSFTDSFQHKYPFYRVEAGESLWPAFWIWQGFYLLQFFALEFFFRGFILHGVKKRFGFYSIWVMMVPYCMIHFSKPFPETIGAIFAGIVLGALSLKSRSIWLGVAIHYSVAITMDLASLWQKGVLKCEM